MGNGHGRPRCVGGLQGNVFYTRCGLRDRDGEMWFGGTKGLNSFFPRAIWDNTYVPPVVVTALKQGGETMALGMAPERVRGWYDGTAGRSMEAEKCWPDPSSTV